MSRHRSLLDLTLYLVHQQESLRPPIDHETALRAALEGGVTLVQLREKHASTAEFLKLALRSKELCHQYDVPLLINDRLDIALAVRADGVHIGQDDMPCRRARALLGPEAIIGVSANNEEEALVAIDDGADYIGISPCYDTLSKADLKGLLGPRGVARILTAVSRSKRPIPCVTIGGINLGNIRRTLQGAVSPDGIALDGVAVVSAIISATDITSAAARLLREVKAFKAQDTSLPAFAFEHDFAPLFAKVKQSHAIVQQITNTVVQNDSANFTLALGCSPIMSASPDEAEDLGKVLSCLLINLGTLTASQVGVMKVAAKVANQQKKPIVFDPVGVGASELRRTTTSDLMNHAQMTILKGNAAEIGSIAGVATVATRGVDSSDGPGPAWTVVRDLARRERCIVAMTGATDLVSDGMRTIECSNGHSLLGSITGSGCMTGSAIACFAASAMERDRDTGRCVAGNMLLAAVAGITVINVAAEVAAGRPDVTGPSTFRAALIDEAFRLTAEDVLQRARVIDVNSQA